MGAAVHDALQGGAGGWWQRCQTLLERCNNAGAASAGAAPAAPPALTHHQIVELIEPFVSRGYRFDMAGSDRRARRLLFRPSSSTAAGGARHTLQLDCLAVQRLRVTRALSPDGDGGPVARLQVEGTQLETLLQRLQQVPAQRQFSIAAGCCIAWQLVLMPEGGELRTIGAVAQFAGVTMTMRAAAGGKGRAAIEVQPGPARLKLPGDVFAVLGRQWSLSQPDGTAWRCDLRLHGDAQTRFEDAVQHLARTLAEPPLHFHQRHLRARWAVSVRRSLLLAAWLSLAVLVACAQWLSQARTSALPLLLGSLPLALLWWCYRADMAPRLQWPRLPRAPSWPSWQEPQHQGPTQ